jgi:hypothetical protein
MKTEEQRLYDELYDRDSRRTTSIKDLSSSPTITDYPDAKKHQLVSFIKSGIRILGYILIPFNLFWAAGILVVSEVVGIIEELV